MDARLARPVAALVTLATFLVGESLVYSAGYRTRNFAVSAPTPELAREIGDTAEHFRDSLAKEWIGQEMPAWSKPCPIQARVAPHLGAGGATSFVFDRGEVFGWRMNIQGSRQRILDSVLPHEVTHTVFACYFRQPLPRWADEGACTTVEHPSEIAKQERMLIGFLKQRRGISFSRMFAMKEYPQDVMPLYSQGHSLAQMLIESRGKKAFLEFLNDGMQDENWPRAVRQHYGHENLFALQDYWLNWVKSGRPRLDPGQAPAVQVASAEQDHDAGSVYRGQSPDSMANRDQQADIRPIGKARPSIYAAMATRAAARQSGEAGNSPRESIYDASANRQLPRRY